MLCQCKRLLCNGQVRPWSPPVRSASHYDVLGITPKANQSDIKSAYYKLSMKFHPDKSDDQAAAKKFRDIAAAYEVLGNVRLKKMYDKGLIVGSSTQTTYQPEPEPQDPTLKFYKSHAKRHVAPTMDGKTPIYDFDAWSKNHYGNVFHRARTEREVVRKKTEKKNDTVHANRQEASIYLMFLIVCMFVTMVLRGKTDYDNDTITHNRKIAEQKAT